MTRAAAWSLVACLLACACTSAPRPPARAADAPAEARAPAAAAAARPERAVLIAVHGLVPEHYLGRGGASPAAPALAQRAAAGVAVESMQPVFPAALHPALATLASGRAPLSHRVLGARALDPRDRSQPPATIAGPTLVDAVAAAGGTVAALEWPNLEPRRLAVWLPDLEAVRRGASWPLALARAASADVQALAERAGAGAEEAWRAGPAHDAVLVRAACELLGSAEPPRLVLLRLSQTEAALAAAPPDTDAARRAVASVDTAIGRLEDCLDDSGRLATTALVVAGDHGTAGVHTVLRPNAALADAGLATVDPMGAVIAWDALARAYGATAFVYASETDAAILARRALELAARETQAFRLLSAEEMLRRGADPQAWFGLEAEPGFAFDEVPLGAVMAPAPPSGAGGLPSGDPRMAAGLVAWGAGVRSGVRVPALRQTDVAPTLARLLGVALDGAEGRVMVGWLQEAGVPGGAAAARATAR